MILPDVNVLIYAFRSDSVDHPKYRRWLEGVLRGVAPYGMSPQVLASVVRIVTHRRVFAEPDSLRTALAFAGQLLEQPHCQVILPGPRHWNIFCDLCRRASVQGNLVQDAWFAALAIEAGCQWITVDRDYTRFPGLSSGAPF